MARVDKELRVEIDPGQLSPEPGDLITITWTVAGRVLDAGRAAVTSISAGVVTAHIVSGKPNRGMVATIWVTGPDDSFRAGEALYLSEEPEDQDLKYERRDEIANHYVKAAKAGHAGARSRLVELAELWLTSRNDLVRDAEEVFVDAARRGSPGAQYVLGYTFFFGSERDGIPAKPAEAVTWLRMAAAQGHADAIGHLGTAYHIARGVERDHERAHALYEEAIKAGSIDALHAMALHLMSGRDHGSSKGAREKARKESFAMLQRAAEAGQCFGIYDLANAYVKGAWMILKVKKNEKRGLEWHQTGARAGCGLSQSSLTAMGKSW